MDDLGGTTIFFGNIHIAVGGLEHILIQKYLFFAWGKDLSSKEGTFQLSNYLTLKGPRYPFALTTGVLCPFGTATGKGDLCRKLIDENLWGARKNKWFIYTLED